VSAVADPLIPSDEWDWQSDDEPPPPGTPLEYAAAYYTRQGLAVMPLIGKNPAAYGPDWWTRAVNDPHEALMVFSNSRYTNIGWAQGYGTIAIDVDHPAKLTDEVRDVIRTGAINHTRAGREHRIFATGERFSGSTSAFPCLGWGEIRAFGSQIVIWGPHPDEPSAHYCYDARQEVPALPERLAGWLRPRGAYEDAATPEGVEEFIAEHTESIRRQAIKAVFDAGDELIADGESIHETTVKTVAPWVFRDVRAGLYDAAYAVDQLTSWWETKWQQRASHPANANGEPQRTEPHWNEISGIVSWAVAQAMGESDEDLAERRARVEITTPEHPDAGEFPAAIDDAHMAVAFGTHLNGDFLYVAAWRRWLRWDGRRWADDDTEAIHERCRQWVIALSSAMIAAGVNDDTIRRVVSYRSRAKLDAVVTLTRRLAGIAATVDEFDRDPDILNVANGIVDLRTGELRPHDRGARCRKLADTDYNPDARHPDVDAVLAVVDDDVRPWLQRLFGYAATGHVTEDVIAVFDGDGSNGKSTLLGAVGRTLGDYAGAAPARLIMRTHNDEHPTIKADLLGRRLVWISETEEGGSLRMEQLKALTGGDRIKARFMRADYFEFTPTHTLIVATNHRPNVNASEYAAWRRLRLVPFPHTYKSPGEAGDGDRVKDARLRVRLTHSAQRSAMLAWIVAGAVEWYRDGLGESATVTAATEAWRRSEDVIVRFVQECLILGEGGTVRGQDLFNAYKDWCAQEGRPAKSNKNFAEAFITHEMVKSAGVERVRPQNQVHYKGVKIVGIARF